MRAASVLRTNPVSQSSTISGTAPWGVATTGVPQARASTITMPKGSGQATGLSRQRGTAEELQLLGAVELAQVLDVAPQVRAHAGVEVGLLVRLAELGGDLQRYPGGVGQVSGDVHALLGGHAPQERGVPAVAGAHRVRLDVHTVVDDRRDRRRPRGRRLVAGDRDDRHLVGQRGVELAEVTLERAVVGRDDREREARAVERSGGGVVVHHVGAPGLRRVVAVDDVAQLDHRAGDPDAGGLGQHPGGLHRAGAVAGRDQEHVVPHGLQTPCEGVQHGFGAAVGGRRNGNPRRSDDRDAHCGEGAPARHT